MNCEICPHECVLDEGQIGFCRARTVCDGAVVPLCYGAVSALALDPIEKKPFYHFHPGAYILSVGGYGCNMRCAFCQNHEISQFAPQSARVIAPKQLVEEALALVPRGNIGLAYTYNEPGIHFEYVRDASRLIKERGLINALVTNGYLCAKAFDALLDTIDAYNIDLKCFHADGYRTLAGELSIVQRNIEAAVERVHVELTTLIVPGLSDVEADMEREAKWIASLSPDIPLHLSRYFPRYRATMPATPVSVMQALSDIARGYLHHVHLGNV